MNDWSADLHATIGETRRSGFKSQRSHQRAGFIFQRLSLNLRVIQDTMVKIEETAGTKTYSCELCGESFFSFGLTEKHEKWECSQVPEETVTDDIKEEATDEERDSGEMRVETMEKASTPLRVLDNSKEGGEKLEIFTDHVKLIVPKIGWLKGLGRIIGSAPEGIYTFSIEDITVNVEDTAVGPSRLKIGNSRFGIANRLSASSQGYVSALDNHVNLYSKNRNLLDSTRDYILETELKYKKEKAIEREKGLEKVAKDKEKHLDYEGAIKIYDEINMPKEAARVRKLMAEQGAVKVAQTVIHGDYVDDRDTIVKDSVINKSNIGAGGKSKAEQIKEIKELLDAGAISEEDYQKMKREIVG
jgi:hypothetical protein